MSKKYKYKTVLGLVRSNTFFHGLDITIFNGSVLMMYAFTNMFSTTDPTMAIIGIALATIATLCGLTMMVSNITTKRKRVPLSEIDLLKS